MDSHSSAHLHLRRRWLQFVIIIPLSAESILSERERVNDLNLFQNTRYVPKHIEQVGSSITGLCGGTYLPVMSRLAKNTSLAVAGYDLNRTSQ
jgi:hypothetical protein